MSIKKYEEIKLLGEGTYGKAYLVRNKEDNSLAVIKTIDLGNISEEAKNESLQEAEIQRQLNHQNIIRFRDFVVEKISKDKQYLHIIMDYADGGDLSQQIKKQREENNGYFKEKQILDWFTQICLAIKHIHDRKILHRDLKSQNIFLTKNGIVKLGDFGIAKHLNKTIDKAKTMVGTPYYLSPEIINNSPYDFKSDIWSLGVLLYEMCALSVPFDAPNIPQLSMKIINGNYNPIPSQYSKELKSLVNDMLNVNSAKRPSINEILKRGIIKNRIKAFLNEVEFNNEFSHTILHHFNIFKKNDKDTITTTVSTSNQSNQVTQGGQSGQGKFNSKGSNNNNNNNNINFNNHNHSHQKPVIRNDRNSGNSKKNNYHYKNNNNNMNLNLNSGNNNINNDLYINSNNINNSEENIAWLKKNLIGNPIEKNINIPQNKNEYRRLSSNNNNYNYNINNNLNIGHAGNSGNNNKMKIVNNYNSNNVPSNPNNQINNNQMIGFKHYENDSQQGKKNSASNAKEQKKIDRSDSRGSGSKDGQKNQLKDFIKQMKEKYKKNPQESNGVVWMKGMKEYVQNSEYEKEVLKSSENNYKKIDNKDINDIIDSQQMLLEYAKLQNEDVENDLNLNSNNYYSQNNVNDEEAEETFDENAISGYYLSKNEDEGKIFGDEKLIDEHILEDINNEIGEGVVGELTKAVKKYVNDDILFFDFDELSGNIKSDLEKNNGGRVNLEKCIDKIPDIYYLILRGKL